MPKSFMAILDSEEYRDKKIQWVYVCGHLGKDAQNRVTQSGKNLTKNSIAVNRGQELAEWIALTWWDNDQATRLVKGQAIRILGRLELSEYNGKTTKSITVDRFIAYPPRKRQEAEDDSVF